MGGSPLVFKEWATTLLSPIRNKKTGDKYED
jgi:hypothetical protein